MREREEEEEEEIRKRRFWFPVSFVLLLRFGVSGGGGALW
jgi:hypothetical protein